MNKTCAVCNGNYFDIMGNICDYHAETWIVTTCVYCCKAMLSNESGVCPYHARNGNAHTGFNKDRRASIRSYGLDSE